MLCGRGSQAGGSKLVFSSYPTYIKAQISGSENFFLLEIDAKA